MKVVDLLKEQKLLKRKYFNNCACLIEPVDEYASEQEKSQARERIVKCHSETKKALERYNELQVIKYAFCLTNGLFRTDQLDLAVPGDHGHMKGPFYFL